MLKMPTTRPGAYVIATLKGCTRCFVSTDSKFILFCLQETSLYNKNIWECKTLRRPHGDKRKKENGKYFCLQSK